MFNIDEEITLDGEQWIIRNIGATVDNETVLMCDHKTRGTQCKNGWHPAGIMVWVDHATLATRSACN
jgi:hypothetical protein